MSRLTCDKAESVESARWTSRAVEMRHIMSGKRELGKGGQETRRHCPPHSKVRFFLMESSEEIQCVYKS